MKKCLFALLLVAAPAWGQSMTSSGSGTWNAPTTVSNYPDILVSGGNFNAWHDMKFTAAKIFSDQNTTYAIDSSCNGYSYADVPSNTWTKHTEWGCVQVLHNMGLVLYGLEHNTNSGYYLSQWTGSAWSDSSCCFADFSPDPTDSGIVVFADNGGRIWDSINSGATITQITGTPCSPDEISSLSAAASDSSHINFYLACSNQTVWKYTAGTWTKLPGAATQISVDAAGNLYAQDFSGNDYHWNGTSWDKIASPNGMNWLANGGPMNIWGLSGSKVYRLSDKAIEWSRSYSGSVSCAPGVPQALCATFTHNASVQIQTGRKVGTKPTQQWNGAGSWGFTSKVHTNDMFDCLLNATAMGDCAVSEAEGNMECSGGGSNNDNAPSGILDKITAHSYMQRVPGTAAYQMMPPKPAAYAYQTSPYCSNTTLPMWNPSVIIGAKHADDVEFYTGGPCFSLFGSPYFCFYDFAGVVGPFTGLGTRYFNPEYEAGTEPGPGDCTPEQ